MNNCRRKLYNFLVNRHAGICQRYHCVHDRSRGIGKILSWIYLLWLNLCYYILFCRFLENPKKVSTYEEKKLLLMNAESAVAASEHPSIEGYVEQLLTYDVVSFDIFDTLIFRPFSDPTDIFYHVGERLKAMDFKSIRVQMEHQARLQKERNWGHIEVTLADIWQVIQQETGMLASKGMEIEQELELQFCYANPFMADAFSQLIEAGKRIIIVSDMYLSAVFLQKILEKAGIRGYEKLYVSCEYGKSKAVGTLYEVVKSEFPQGTRFCHVGDNQHSDIKMAGKAGISTMYYPNVNYKATLYRTMDMSPIVGGAYRGLVQNTLYSGNNVWSIEREYGFVYGGLFVVGYCHFIHEYAKSHEIDRIMFLARDGEILKRAYEKMYPQDDCRYVYWSRLAATKLMAQYDKHDYFRRFLFHKINQGKTIEQILEAMELSSLIIELRESMAVECELTDSNVVQLKEWLQERFEKIVEIYEAQNIAAKTYYEQLLEDCRSVVAVDIGWAGSGAMALSYLAENVWNLPCQIVGIIAGTNTVHNAEPYASEAFMQSGKLVSYLYSQAHNRDLLKKHNPNKNYNVYWELLLSSPTKQFSGFGLDAKGQVELQFGKMDLNQEGICQIQRGIMDFVDLYISHFDKLPYMFRISGRDAYAPMLVAASYEEKYLREIEKRFGLEIHVG